MHRRRSALAAVSLAVAAFAAGCGGTKTVTVTNTVTHVRTVTTAPAATTTTGTTTASAACSGGDLTATFSVIQGSAGAGTISYELVVTNSSSSPCFVSGVPDVVLLDANHAVLPTHGRAAQAGQGTAVRVDLQPGSSAKADARFSPDVAGTGDKQTGQCQPTASTLRVGLPGGGTVDAAIDPPTAVCEQGTLSFSVFTAA